MSESPWRDESRRAAAAAGVAQARARLRITRDGDRYMVGDKQFTSWDAAIQHVLETPEGESA